MEQIWITGPVHILFFTLVNIVRYNVRPWWRSALEEYPSSFLRTMHGNMNKSSIKILAILGWIFHWGNWPQGNLYQIRFWQHGCNILLNFISATNSAIIRTWKTSNLNLCHFLSLSHSYRTVGSMFPLTSFITHASALTEKTKPTSRLVNRIFMYFWTMIYF